MTIILILALYLSSASVKASVLGPPVCTFQVAIQQQTSEGLRGYLSDTECSNMLGCNKTECDSYLGRQVEITGITRRAKLMLEVLRGLRIGIEEGTSMGPDGLVHNFMHWSVVEIRDETNTLLTPEQVYMFDGVNINLK